jgi:hypothetical protein
MWALPRFSTEDGSSLMLAAESGNHQAVYALVQNGARVNQVFFALTSCFSIFF